MKATKTHARHSVKLSVGTLLLAIAIALGGVPLAAQSGQAQALQGEEVPVTQTDDTQADDSSPAAEDPGSDADAGGEAPQEEEPGDEQPVEDDNTGAENEEDPAPESAGEGDAPEEQDGEEEEDAPAYPGAPLTFATLSMLEEDLFENGNAIAVDNAADLRAALGAFTGDDTLVVALENDITLGTDGDSGEALTTSADNATILFKGNGAQLINAAGNRHMQISGAQDITLAFEGVSLVGDGTAGGLVLTNSATTITGAFITGNTSVDGGGLYVDGGSLALKNSLLDGNRATTTYNSPANGGGIYATNGADITIKNSNFQRNEAWNEYPGTGSSTVQFTYGGGIYMAGGTNLTLEGNVTFGGAEGLGNRAVAGGGIYCAEGYTNPLTLGAGIRFTHNHTGVYTAYTFGGAIALASEEANLVIDGATLDHNSSESKGGAVHIGGGNLTIHSGSLSYNHAKSAGGAIWAGEGTQIIVYNGVINYNTTNSTLGAAIHAEYFGNLPDNGGLLALYGGQVNNNTVVGSLSAGGAIYCNDILIDGGEVNYNSSTHGFASAIACRTFTMHSGSVSYNTIGYSAYLSSGSTVTANHGLTISGGDIIGNVTEDFDNPTTNSLFYGAISCENGETLITGGNFKDNKAHYGGALGLFGSKATITGGNFENNASAYGGGAVAVYTSAHIGGNASFTGNTARTEGGAVLKSTGTLLVDGNASFTDNEALNIHGGAFVVFANSTTKLIDVTIEGNVTFTGNTAPYGGAFSMIRYSSDANQYPTAEEAADRLAIGGEVRFTNNTAPGSNRYWGNGGAVYTDNLAWVTVEENVTFQGNESEIAYWMTDDDDIAQHDSLVKTTRFTDGFLYGYNNSDISYTRGEPLEYATVTFDLNYTDGGVYTTTRAHPYQPVPRPEDPDREGYNFAGWFTLEEAKWDFADDRIEEDTTLYARWTPKIYDVVYHYNDGSGTTLESTARYGSKLSEPDEPTRSEYTFGGWAMENQTIWDFAANTMPAHNLALYAQWTENPTTSSSSSSEPSTSTGGDSSQETGSSSSSSEASTSTGGDSSQETGSSSSSSEASTSSGGDSSQETGSSSSSSEASTSSGSDSSQETGSSSSSSEASTSSGSDSSQETSSGSSSNGASSNTGGDSSRETSSGSSSNGASSNTGGSSSQATSRGDTSHTNSSSRRESSTSRGTGGNNSSSGNTGSASSGTSSGATGGNSSSSSSSQAPGETTAPPVIPEDPDTGSNSGNGGNSNGGNGNYTLNDDGSITYTTPGGSKVTLAEGSYSILDDGTVVDHTPGSPYYVQDNGTAALFGNEIPLGGLASRGGWGLVNLLLAIAAVCSAIGQGVYILVRKKEVTLPRALCAASGLLPLLAFLILENKSQMLLFSKWTPLCVVLVLLHAALPFITKLFAEKIKSTEK